MGVMLEAFCDLTDFDAIAGFDTVQEVYAPWHALEEQSLSGRLLTNIFAGGTVDTEWGFLTGASEHDEYRGATGPMSATSRHKARGALRAPRLQLVL